MKKLAVLFAFLFCAIAANAQAYNGVKTCTAEFDVLVIKPLVWNTPANVQLEEVIAGTTRTFAAQEVNFELTGQPNYDVTIVPHGPAAVGTESLIGTWSATPLKLSESEGKASIKYSCTGITSSDPAAARGSRVFTISVDAYYSSL